MNAIAPQFTTTYPLPYRRIPLTTEQAWALMAAHEPLADITAEQIMHARGCSRRKAEALEAAKRHVIVNSLRNRQEFIALPCETPEGDEVIECLLAALEESMPARFASGQLDEMHMKGVGSLANKLRAAWAHRIPQWFSASLFDDGSVCIALHRSHDEAEHEHGLCRMSNARKIAYHPIVPHEPAYMTLQRAGWSFDRVMQRPMIEPLGVRPSGRRAEWEILRGDEEVIDVIALASVTAGGNWLATVPATDSIIARTQTFGDLIAAISKPVAMPVQIVRRAPWIATLD